MVIHECLYDVLSSGTICEEGFEGGGNRGGERSKVE